MMQTNVDDASEQTILVNIAKKKKYIYIYIQNIFFSRNVFNEATVAWCYILPGIIST